MQVAMTDMVKICEDREDVFRYAWFTGRWNDPSKYTNLFSVNAGSLEEVGTHYLSLPFTVTAPSPPPPSPPPSPPSFPPLPPYGYAECTETAEPGYQCVCCAEQPCSGLQAVCEVQRKCWPLDGGTVISREEACDGKYTVAPWPY